MSPVKARARKSPPDITPLVVDVDGTLLKTDLLHEAVLHLIAHRPLAALGLPLWLAGGRSRLKAELAQRASPGLETVPLRGEVMVLIRQAQAAGRKVYLASASDRSFVEAVAARIGGMAGVFATEAGGENLAGKAKAAVLVESFGAGGYDYVGDQPIDFPVWRQARRAYAVAHSDGFAARLRAAFPQVEIIAQPRSRPADYVRALRPHQWAKNVIIFLPVVTGHLFGLSSLLAAFVAFCSFSLAASSAYVLNDLLDLPGDRAHGRKSGRPFAAGAIPVAHGMALSAALMTAAFGLSLLLPTFFTVVLAIYVTFTLSYSLYLKRKLFIDVIVLALLYAVRVYGGLAATQTRDTEWLLMFSLFFFLSLAIVKRCSELVAIQAEGRGTLVKGRSYWVMDIAALQPLGAAAGYAAVVVVALYLSSYDVAERYSRPNLLWLVCPLLLYWISRALVMANRGVLHDDPVVFALTDRASWWTALAVVLVILAAI